MVGVMIRLLLILALSASTAAARPARMDDAGISFFQQGTIGRTDQIRFRFAQHAWRMGAVHVHSSTAPLYDYRISPGRDLIAEAILVRTGRRLARAATKLPIEGDRRYLVYAVVQPGDPTASCMGCSPASSAAIPGDDANRLWIYWSFNGISGPIVF